MSAMQIYATVWTYENHHLIVHADVSSGARRTYVVGAHKNRLNDAVILNTTHKCILKYPMKTR